MALMRGACGLARRTAMASSSSSLSVVARPASTEATAAESSSTPRVKYPSRWRRARAMMNEVRADGLDKMRAKMRHIREPLPDWRVGDAVELQYAFERGDENPTVLRGSIVGRRRKGIESSFVIKNEFGDDVLTARIPLMTPLLRSMRVMRKNHVRGGRRVRRAQLTYLSDRPVSEYRVTVETKEEWEHALEAKIRKELQRAGRNWGKQAVADEKAKILRTGKGVVRVDASMDFSDEDIKQAAATARSNKRRRQAKAKSSRSPQE